MRKLSSLYAILLSATTALTGCQSPLGNYDSNNSSRDLWKRLSPNQYEQIVQKERNERNSAEPINPNIEDWLLVSDRRNVFGEEREYKVSKTKLIRYFGERIGIWVKENLDEESPIRRTIDAGERIVKWGEDALEGVKDQEKDYFNIEESDINLKIGTNKIGIEISFPLDNRADDYYFRQKVEEYRLEMASQEASTLAKNK